MKMLFKARGATFLENVCKVLLAAVCLLHVPAQAQFPAQIGDLDGDGVPTVLDLQRLLNHISGTNEFRLVPDVPGLTRQERDEFLDLTRDGLVNQADVLAGPDAILGRTTLPAFPATRLVEASPAHGEEMVSPDRTVIVRFSRRIQPTTITSNAVYLVANNERFRGRLEVSSTAMFATFFPLSPLPASTEIRLVVDGNLIRDLYGLPVDTRSADGSSARGISTVLADGASVLRGQFDFRTLPLFRIPGTAVSGYVFDSYRTNGDGSPVPIIGATIRVDAFPEANDVTDERGYFTLTNVPAPQFFVHIDGSTAANAPPGFTYPSGGKLFHSVPGLSTVMPRSFAVYLPPMAIADAKPLRTDILTDVFFGPEGIAQLQRMFPTNDVAMFQKVCVRFPPRSAMDNAGRLATTGTIIPVPPDRIPSPLPPNLNPRLVISVQAMLPDGSAATRLDVPAAVVFPNLDGLAPGEKALFFSFNHAAGRWDVIGAGTATTNGTIETDPGVGIRAPGWHLVQVGTDFHGQPCERGKACARYTGKHGDVVVVDLRGTAGGQQYQGFSIGPLTGGQIFRESDGLFYFAPSIGSPSRSPTMPATGNPGVVSGTFTVTLFGNPSDPDPDPNSGCVRTSPTTVRCTGELRIEVDDGYSANVGGGFESLLDRLRVQQRLKYLGFPGPEFGDLQLSGVLDRPTKWATELFDAAVSDRSFGAIDTSGNPNPGPLDGAANHPNAPRWIRNGNKSGTSWAWDVIAAARTAGFDFSLLGDLSLPAGGPFFRPDFTGFRHGSHQAGMDIDAETRSTDDGSVPWYRIWTARDGRNYLATTDSRDGGGNLVRNIISRDPNTRAYYASPLDGDLNRGVRHDYEDVFNNEPVLTAINSFGLFIDNVEKGYSLDAVTTQIRAFQNANITPSGARAGAIWFNDPRTWGLGVSFKSGHGGHFHVNVTSPLAAAQLPSPWFQPASPTPISTAAGFGSDTRLYYRFQLANGFELAGRSSMAGTFTEILSPNTDYALTLYRAADNRWAVYRGRSNASGAVTDLGTLILDQQGGPDGDGDGIPDQGEYALGTDPASRDSDGDGLTDDAELTQGLNPNNRAAFPTGVIASLPLRGEAKEVVVEENLAYVATGRYGLAIVDVSRFDNPIVLGQLDLPGNATDVAVDTTLRLAVVACTNSLQIVDVNDPMSPRIVRSFNLAATRVEVMLNIAFVTTGAALRSVNLVTGEIMQTLNLSSGNLTDIAKEGLRLYTMSSLFQLRSIEVVGFAMQPRGSLTLQDGGGRLFVGNGIAYPTARFGTNGRGGFSAVSVADATNLTLISGPDVRLPNQRPQELLVPNGSGIGLLVGSPPTGPTSSQPQVNVMNLRNPEDTDASLIEIRLVSPPSSAAIASGVGMVAGGSNGLVVLNYLPFDRQQTPPSITLSASFQLMPAQVEEGKAVSVTARVADDVQVRDVKYYINRQEVATDVSFPFEHRFVTPRILGGSNSFLLRAKATDTGGNFAWSDEITVALTDDATGPVVTRVVPADGSAGVSNTVVACYFNEPLMASTITGESFQLRHAGADGHFDTQDDVRLQSGSLAYNVEQQAVIMRFSTNLPRGLYEASVRPPLADVAGNILATPAVWRFNQAGTLCEALPSDCTDSDLDGIPNSRENSLGLNSFSADSDGDGILDGDEDIDGDGVGNGAEILMGSDPTAADLDRDGLNDYMELFAHQTQPNNSDTDGDGWPDGLEVLLQSDPRNRNVTPRLRISLGSSQVDFINAALDKGATNLFLASPIISYENR